ncbi:MAG: excinuclease ABC subunit UvrC [Syntrophobacterales bacterium]|nr:excinuclease ABC subunit UvrC [Syntrophobacterales bacterium]
MPSGLDDPLRLGENKFPTNLLTEDLSLAKEVIPEGCGVYFFEDAKGSVLYVGKAINLRRRLSSYFRSPLPLKIASMMKKANAFEFIVTRNEKEALLLEAQLIKKFRPPYNVVLRDDKNYPSIRINTKESFPKLETVRQIRRDGAFYFGPYPSSQAMNEVVKVLRRAFPLRKCPSQNFMKRSRPCINHDLGLCLAPCAGKISKKQYYAIVRDLIRFLNGDDKFLREKLIREMQEASESLEFEKAAILRDRLFALDALMERQSVVSHKRINRDVFGYFSDGRYAFVSVVYVRSGTVTGHKSFDVSTASAEEDKIVSSFISQYYSIYPFVPEEILLPFEVEDRVELEEYLTELRGAPVTIVSRGDDGIDVELLELALSNAKEQAKVLLSHSSSRKESLELLKDFLKLNSTPESIACIDISNLQGKYTTGAIVIFKNGIPIPGLYRTCPLGELVEQNDPAMIQATIEKLAIGEPKFFEEIDLLVVDGGKGQLHGAIRALEKLSHGGFLKTLPTVVALAKERGPSSKPERLFAEKLYLSSKSDPLLLSNYPKVRKFLQMIRDEAHRYALTAYQRQHRRSLHKSVLDAIRGIGPKRKKILLNYFGDVESISQARLEDLLAIPGIPEEVAKGIYEFFHPQR